MNSQVIRLTTVIGAAVLAAAAAQAQAPQNQTFDTFALGSVNGQGAAPDTWQQWGSSGGLGFNGGAVSTAFAHSGTQSLGTELLDDKIVDRDTVYGSLGGRWNWSVWCYTPATQVLPQWAIFLGDYHLTPSFGAHWMSQAKFDPSLGQVAIDMGPKSLLVCPGGTTGNQFAVTAPLVVGAWTELRYDIDTTTDRVQCWYNNAPVGQLWQLSDGISAGFSPNGATFGTIDLYANGNTLAGDRGYWDDVTITANTDPKALDCLGQFNVYCTAGTSFSGCVPTIVGSGVPSATAGAGFSIDLLGSEGNRQGLLFYGMSGQNLSGAPWGPGSSSTLCVKAPTQRTPLQALSGTAGNCDANYTFDWNTYMSTALTPPQIGYPRQVGCSFDAQYWYRDNTGGAKTTSLSDGLHFTVGP